MTATTTLFRMLFPITTTTAPALAPATAQAPAARAPAARAPAARAPAAEAPAAAALDAATTRSSSQPQHRRPEHLQQGARTPRPPASPEDGRNIQTLAATAPGPRNAVKGSQPGTRMAKPRFKAVRATIEVAPAPGATATDAPTIIRHKNPNPKLERHQRQLIRCFATS